MLGPAAAGEGEAGDEKMKVGGLKNRYTVKKICEVAKVDDNTLYRRVREIMEKMSEEDFVKIFGEGNA